MSDVKNLKSLGSKKTKYYNKPNIKILETFENKYPERLYLVPFVCNEFTSLCPKTGQPDFATIEIIYIPNKKMVESKSLKLYLFSFRNSGEFHEDVINRITGDLVMLLQPRMIRVFGDFNIRGGIAIKPVVRYFESEYYHELSKDLTDNWDRIK